MIHGLYAVQDTVAQMFHPPFCAPTPGSAERFVADLVNGREEHPYSQHPGDYFLWKVGEYDDVQGLLLPVTPDRLLCLAQFKP